MKGNNTASDTIFHLASALNDGRYTMDLVINDINTMKPMATFSSNMTAFGMLVRRLFPQDSDTTTTKTMYINTSYLKRCDVILATDSKFPVMKNMVRRIGVVHETYSKLYDRLIMYVRINNKDYDANDILKYVMNNEPSLFGINIKSLKVKFQVERDRTIPLQNKKVCKIDIDVEGD